MDVEWRRMPWWKWLAVALVALALTFVAVFQLKYRSWPFQAPRQLAWCGMGWERGERTERPPRVYPVGRKPPLFGVELYSPYPPAERRRLSTGEMAEPCGSRLLAREGDHFVAYEVDPRVAH